MGFSHIRSANSPNNNTMKFPNYKILHFVPNVIGEKANYLLNRKRGGGRDVECSVFDVVEY